MTTKKYFEKLIDIPPGGRYMVNANLARKGGAYAMKINEVEQLVGITKKNIRFYEEKGLLEPKRQVQNGYRDYSDGDVDMLRRIKLLRKLSVPIEEIKKLQTKHMTLEDCLRRHEISLAREEKNLSQIREMCEELQERGAEFETLSAQELLAEMEAREKGGTRLMDVAATDRKRKKKIAPLIVAAVVTLFMAAYMVLVAFTIFYEKPVPSEAVPVMIIMALAPLAVIVGILIAVRERLKEIRDGEEDAASKY